LPPPPPLSLHGNMKRGQQEGREQGRDDEGRKEANPAAARQPAEAEGTRASGPIAQLVRAPP
jgi:hypothetical protein